MIRVTPAPEPAIFDARVRQPGQKFLNSLPPGRKVNFRGREHWRRILDDLHDAYGGVCAYTCHYVPLDTGGDTVEHFDPKDTNPALAYEWTNFRFVCNRMNGRKGPYTDVVDPFSVIPGMFELEFPSLQVEVGSAVTGAWRRLAGTTISRLGLNKERNVKARTKYVLDLRDHRIDVKYLSTHAPFIHSEMSRQGIAQQDLSTIMTTRAA